MVAIGLYMAVYQRFFDYSSSLRPRGVLSSALTALPGV